MDRKDTGMQPLLTIAIPTYNRESYLELGLQRLGEELNALGPTWHDKIRVSISNNASTDGTADVLARDRNVASGAFEVVNNAENIGGERNVAQCYARATTPYVWVLGDDDVILPGGLAPVMEALEKHTPDILYVHGYSYTDDYLAEPERGRGRRGIIDYRDALGFVRHAHVMLTFITALIVRTGAGTEQDRQATTGSNLPQMGWVLPLVRDGNRFVVLRNRVYAAKIANSGDYGAIEVFGRNLDRIARQVLRSRPDLMGAIQNGTIVTWFPIYLLSIRLRQGVFHSEDVEGGLKQLYGGNWRYLVFLKPLVVLPLSLARIYFLFIRASRLLLSRVLI